MEHKGGVVTQEKRSVAVGDRVRRVDGREKVTGSAVYGVDVNVPRMLFGKILRSPHPHAAIRRIDTSRAEALPGVRAVVIGKDTPGIPFGFFKIHNDQFADMQPLARDKVRYVGEEVAAVAAVDEDTAQIALDLIDVEYEELPAVFEPEDALRPGAPLVHEQIEDNVIDRILMENGDLDEGFEAADVVIEDSFRTTPASQVCLETQQAVAQWDASGRVTVWASIQMPFLLRAHLAATLGIDESRVRVIRTVIGGGFGKRMEMHAADPIACILARRTNEAVKIVYTREEEFLATRCRHRLILDTRIGAKRDGTLTAIEMKAITDSGAYVSQAPGITRVAGGNAMTLYRAPAVHFEAEIVYTNNPPGGAYRGYGNPQGTIALETAMDALAAELEMDPVALRRKNAPKPNSLSNLGQKITTCGATDCLEEVAERLDWAQRRHQSPEVVDGKVRGIGLASAVNVGGGARDLGNNDGCGAFVKIEDDGGVMVMCGGQEIGTGGSTVIAQVVSHELGVPIERIQILNSDTNVMPWDIGCHAQRNTFVLGHAARIAATDARDELFRAAAEMLETAQEDLVGKDDQVFARGAPSRSVPIPDVVRNLHYRPGGTAILGKGYYDPPTVPTDPRGKGNKSASYSYACHGVEIEVELDSGRVTVLRVVAAHDCGKAINPMDVEGQIEGGVAQALGWALTEELVWKEGRTLNPDLLDYKVLTTMDVPDTEVVLVETADPEGPYGAKGVAEISIVPTAAAVANALAHATGSRFRSLPFSPQKILSAVQAQAAEGGLTTSSAGIAS